MAPTRRPNPRNGLHSCDGFREELDRICGLVRDEYEIYAVSV
jgi:hypothetical protein